jgi:hypothetical protein
MFDFPDNPSDGDTVNHPNGLLYQWSSTNGVWSVVQDNLATLTARVVALESVLQNQLILE